MAPMARLLAFTVKAAPDADNVELPRAVLPSEKVTLPVGVAVPLALTVAVSTVEAVDAMEAGFAASEVVVATGGTVTITEIVPLEFEKLPLAT